MNVDGSFRQRVTLQGDARGVRARYPGAVGRDHTTWSAVSRPLPVAR